MSHEVFISHSTKDNEIADQVCSYLEEQGITYWIATRDARPGRDWAESIVNAILECKILLLIFSSNSNDSPQIHREINIAADEGIPILPFRIENIRPSAKLRYYLSTPHWLDALPSPNENHFMRLVNSVNTFLSTDPQPAPAPDREKPEGPRPENVVARIGYAEVLKAQGNLSDAASVYKATMESHPENIVARNGYAEVLKAQGNLSDAAAVYKVTIESYPEDVVARNGYAEILKAQGTLAETAVVYKANLSIPITLSESPANNPKPAPPVQFHLETRSPSGDISTVGLILRFFFSLFSFDRFALTGVIDNETFMREKKLIRNAGIIAACWLLVSILSIVIGANGPMEKELLLGLLGLYMLPFLISGWILAYLAKTHLIYGVVCGTLACASFYTFALIMDGSQTARNSEFSIIVLLASLTVLLLLIAVLKKWPIVWISFGILSLFYLVVGIYNYRYIYSPYRYLLLFGIAGTGATIFAMVKSRANYIFNKNFLGIS